MTHQPNRLSSGGRIDRRTSVRISIDGTEMYGHPGDSVASVMLANGCLAVGPSIYRDRPRGILTAGVEEPNALLQVTAPWSEPMLPASTVPAVDGLVAETLSGMGRLDPAPDEAVYDKKYVHTDVLVIGGGPAGLAAASSAVESGARVILVDDQPELGGSLLSSSTEQVDGVPALRWAETIAESIASAPDALVLRRTTAVGGYDDNYVLAVQHRTDHLGTPPAGVSRQRLWHIRAAQVVLATGAHERPLVFARNDRPGVMLASAVRTYLNRYAVAPGRRVLVSTTNDSAYDTVGDLVSAGVEVGEPLDVGCDLLAVSGGWSPAVHLHCQRQGRVRWDDECAGFVPEGEVRDQHVAGAARGVFRLADCVTDGVRAGAGAGEAAGFRARERAAATETVADVGRATGAGMRNVEHVKRYTSIGTGNDQGKTSGVNAIGVIARALGSAGPGEVGTTTYRPPYAPVSFAVLAGRERGELFDPQRTTPVHSWHVEHGAEFELVGQWLRPWYYPRAGEDLDAAVARECRAARQGVAMMDASTLGKIELWGADAGEFLNRMYTNGFKKLKIGFGRYGVMCKPDGMILDDGVTLRTGENRYFMTTTTGNAAAVLDWLEEWLQTEWPDLDVSCTSVTEQWTTIAVVGPQSRAVVARLVPDLDVSAAGFPFMAFREVTLSSGVPARICRISFSGELAYEINVPGWYGLATWEQVHAAGADLDITPYGTETMHVLRAEKGFLIVGQDTDGTVTPQDAGMDWVVSTRKDFVGRRSFSRADTARTDRKHLVGLLTVDERSRLPEGTQLVATGQPTPSDNRPVPALGHVTSSYHSEALGQPFALALVADGRNRMGESLLAPVGDDTVEVRVTAPALYDPEGTRRDG